MKILVTGGVRSGKSRHAEQLMRTGSEEHVLYVAPGPTAADDSDPDWAARVAAHRASRPATWTTVETRNLASVLSGATRPVMVDCLGTWLAGVLDVYALWECSSTTVSAVVTRLVDETVAAMATCGDVVLVTNEVGLGVIPEHRSGRLFCDLLGVVNQRIADACEEVHLVVAGRVIRL